MKLTYDAIAGEFLSKIMDFDLAEMSVSNQQGIVYGYMKKAISDFKHICKYDLSSAYDDIEEEFTLDIDENDIEELINIISDGMVVYWLKPYVYKQELLENAISTRDFTVYSPAELLMRVGNAYKEAQKEYTQSVREYSYNYGDLSSLHT